MKKIEKQFKEGTRQVFLTVEERALMRERLVLYMEHKPIRSAQKQKSGWMPLLPIFRAYHVSGALLIAFVLTGSTFGVSFAAGDALPGDLLYGVKVNINEEVKTAFLSTESRIAWEQERAERRLVEASQLAAEGRLTEDTKQEVSKLFAEHTEAVVERVLAYEETDPVLAAEASSKFEESLGAHEAVLARLIVETEEDPGEGSVELVEQVRSVAMEVEKIREDAEEKIEAADDGNDEGGEVVAEDVPDTKEEGMNSANMRVRAAYRAQNRAFELLEKVESQYSELDSASEMAAQVLSQIEYGKTLLEKGDAALAEHDYGTAYSAHKKAATVFQKVTQLLEVAKLFSVDVYTAESDVFETDEAVEETNENTDDQGEEVGETDEDTEAQIEQAANEQREMLERMRTELAEQIHTARTLLLTKSGFDAAVTENANARIKDVVAYQLRGDIALVLGDYDDAEALFTKALEHIGASIRTLEKEIKENGEQIIDATVEVEEATQEQEENAKEYVFTHLFSDGVHTYGGTLELDTPCQVVDVTTSETEGEVTLNIVVSGDESESECVQLSTEKSFVAHIEASESSALLHVFINGVEVEWSILQPEVLGEEVDSAEGGTSTGENVQDSVEDVEESEE